MFQLPQLVDYQVTYEAAERQLQLQLLLTEKSAAVESVICARLQPLLQPGDQLVLYGEALTAQNRETAHSFYAAKRRVLTGDTI